MTTDEEDSGIGGDGIKGISSFYGGASIGDCSIEDSFYGDFTGGLRLPQVRLRN